HPHLNALGETAGTGRWPLQTSATATLIEAFGGLVIGTTAGVIVALLTARFGTARELLLPVAGGAGAAVSVRLLPARSVTPRELLLPVAVGASAVPIIAFAPLMNNWFGVLNPLSKMMIVAVLGFLPVVVT